MFKKINEEELKKIKRKFNSSYSSLGRIKQREDGKFVIELLFRKYRFKEKTLELEINLKTAMYNEFPKDRKIVYYFNESELNCLLALIKKEDKIIFLEPVAEEDAYGQDRRIVIQRKNKVLSMNLSNSDVNNF